MSPAQSDTRSCMSNYSMVFLCNSVKCPLRLQAWSGADVPEVVGSSLTTLPHGKASLAPLCPPELEGCVRADLSLLVGGAAYSPASICHAPSCVYASEGTTGADSHVISE